MPEITLKPVTSSQIAAIGHDAASKTMHVRFSDKADGSPGALYEYANVTPEDFAALESAKSVGSHFYKHFKPHADRYPYRRIDVITVLEALRVIGKYTDEDKLIAYMEKLSDEVKKDDRVPKAFKERRDALKKATA